MIPDMMCACIIGFDTDRSLPNVNMIYELSRNELNFQNKERRKICKNSQAKWDILERTIYSRIQNAI